MEQEGHNPEPGRPADSGEQSKEEGGIQCGRVEPEVVVPPASRLKDSRVEPEVVTGEGQQK